jgi:single-strand DNA-binding protein
MINEATLIGRVGKKDTKELKNGSEMSTIYLATSRKWLDVKGAQQEQTVWHNVNFYNKLSDVVKKYVEVGALVYIKGEINHKQIASGEKQGQWAYSITASQIKILSYSKKQDSKSSQATATTEDFDDDSIPF